MNDARPIDPADRLLSQAEVLDLLGVGRTSLYNLMDGEAFPPPIRMIGRHRRWRRREVLDWINSRPPADREWPAQLAASHQRRHRPHSPR